MLWPPGLGGLGLPILQEPHLPCPQEPRWVVEYAGLFKCPQFALQHVHHWSAIVVKLVDFDSMNADGIRGKLKESEE